MEHLKHILFIDIETVPVMQGYSQLSPELQNEWDKKAKFLKGNTDEMPDPSKLFGEKAGVFSEFAKVVCIVVGSLHYEGNMWKMRLKTLANHDEKVLLNEFSELIARFAARYPELRFCGHNIKEFDIPFLCRRMLINSLPLPDCMNLSGKKPWEVSHFDTLEMWKFGDYKHFTSLALLATILGIPSPKDDMDGSMVGQVYWQEKDLQRISRYCALDVYTTMRVFLRLKGIDIVPEPVYLNE